MLNETIAIYAIIDDLLKAIGHREDIRCEMSDAEIITTALVAAMFFNGNHSKACDYMKGHKLTLSPVRKITIQQEITPFINVNQRPVSSSRNDTKTYK